MADRPAILCRIAGLKGSGPREPGTVMRVEADRIEGTIGGGHLELVAIETARAMLAGGEDHRQIEVVLGPETGQCCGGRVVIRLDRLTAALAAALEAEDAEARAARPMVMVFGAGHVGRALARALVPLPFDVHLVETRPSEMALLDAGLDVRRQLVAMPESLVGTIPAGGAALILTHDHGLDFLIAEAALARSDLAYVGMIGSASKRGVFAHSLAGNSQAEAMLARLVMPIGGGRVADKRPEVIAALVAAELLDRLLPHRT